MKSNTRLVVHLDRQKMVVAGSHLANPLTLDFPVNLIFDMDVADYEGLDLLLNNFLVQNKLAPSEIILVISPAVYYHHLISTTNPDDQKIQTDLFLQTIPFKNLISKNYPFNDHSELVSLNKNFYEPIVRFFEKNNFNVLVILPFLILERHHLELTAFTQKEVKDIYQKYKSLEPFSLLTTQEIDKSVATVIYRPKEDKTRTVILIIVFCGLFVVLLLFIFLRPYLIKPPSSKLTTPTTSASVSPVPLPTESIPTPTIAYLSIDKLNIKIINSSGIPNQAAKIKQQLATSGFGQITTASSAKIYAQKNQITFSPLVSPEIRTKVRLAVESVAGIATEIDTTTSDGPDIQITTTINTNNKATP